VEGESEEHREEERAATPDQQALEARERVHDSHSIE
jgi:hypothetical protein